METRLVFPLVMLLGILLESNLVMPTPVSESDHSVLEQASVFETGKFHPNTSDVRTPNNCLPPRPLLIVRPEEQGTYPVILFHHGTACSNSWYTDVFNFISSHGYIVVAPQLYRWMPPWPSPQEELDRAAKVANWLPSGLRCVLPENIEGDLQNLALAGHSRGGYIAFALALGLAHVSLEVNFSALIGVDPVAGTSKNCQLKPKILHDESCSFNISIPVAIIGTGLGNESVIPLPACAPDGVSHTEFFNECRPPCSHFVTTEYGHMDVFNDDIDPVKGFARTMCKGRSGWGARRDLMRKTVGGISVAFLEAIFKGNYKEYNNILQNPNYFAPARAATLDPVQKKSEGTSCSRENSPLSAKVLSRPCLFDLFAEKWFSFAKLFSF